MKRKLFNLSRRYQDALRSHLQPAGRTNRASARDVGGQALAAGLQTLDLAKLHEQTLVAELLPECPPDQRPLVIREAGRFFARAVLPIEKIHFDTATATHLREFIEALSQRTVELATSNRELKLEVGQRKAAEAALKKSEHHYSQLLERSDHLQEQLRQLSRQIISAQEEERKQISRELHDVIAQTLTSINVRLATLSREASLDTKGLEKNIALTQRLVEKSVDIVHRFARELRPAVLDDLGLIPALHAFVKIFSQRTRISVQVKVFAKVEELNNNQRTTLYRVAQEALTNVARHAHATRVEIKIRKLAAGICMTIQDDGKSFQVEEVLNNSSGRKRLGLLGMRERLDMIGGSLKIDSAPGRGTTITALIPAGKAGEKIPEESS